MDERAGEPWSDREIDEVLDLYLRLLEADLVDERVNKAAAYRRLREEALPARTTGAIESKLQNISAVVNDLGDPIVSGLKPRRNIQGKLTAAVRDRLLQGDFASRIEGAVDLARERPERYAAAPEDVVTDPPTDTYEGPDRLPDTRFFDWEEAERRRIGLLGEEWVADWERARLARADRVDLAERVEHTAVVEGDGAGFDIRSFSTDGHDRLIEVKSTTGSDGRSFYLTRNELRVSETRPDAYWLYRVYGFWDHRRMWHLGGELRRALDLTPTTYRARPHAES